MVVFKKQTEQNTRYDGMLPSSARPHIIHRQTAQ